MSEWKKWVNNSEQLKQDDSDSNEKGKKQQVL